MPWSSQDSESLADVLLNLIILFGPLRLVILVAIVTLLMWAL